MSEEHGNELRRYEVADKVGLAGLYRNIMTIVLLLLTVDDVSERKTVRRKFSSELIIIWLLLQLIIRSGSETTLFLL
jgi:hypothetical protein